MSCTLLFVTLAFIVITSVSSLSVPRATAPADWANDLEAYNVYHQRYMAFKCYEKHNTQFFDKCCHPLLASESPSKTLPSLCTTSSSTSTKKPGTNLNSSKSSSQVVKGGFATYFYQNGNAGACGAYHSDGDLIAAIDAERYGNLSEVSSLCGKKVKIVNPSNGHSVVVTIADACPTCRNGNSIDLSVAAFEHLAALSIGLINIDWWFE